MNGTMTWQGGMAFECETRGLKVVTDAMPEVGGENKGPTPKELLVDAMMGCTAMDVVAMLKKMRQTLTTFTMSNEVEKTTEHPIHFKRSILIFRIDGGVESDKAIKAVESSLTKYCGVNFMISRSCEISYRLFVNGEMVQEGKANF